MVETVAAAADENRTQQPTECAERDGFERVWLAGEEGLTDGNTTIISSGDNVVVFVFDCFISFYCNTLN